jgi:hypothetical protein
MGSLLNKVISFARSPQGKKLIHKAEKVAEDPKTRKEVEDLAAKAGKHHP